MANNPVKPIKVLKNVKGVNPSYFSSSKPKSENNNEKSLLELTGMSMEELNQYFLLLPNHERFLIEKKYGKSLTLIKEYDHTISNHEIRCQAIIQKLITMKNERNLQNENKKNISNIEIKKDKKSEIKNKKNPFEDIEKYGLVARTGLSIEECRERIKYATIKQQEAMYKRYGSNLDELNPYEDENMKKLVKKCIKFITDSNFKYEKKKKEIKRKSYEDVEKYGLVAVTGLPIEECRGRVEFAPIEQQEAMRKRYGFNLDEVHPYLENKNRIYYLVNCCIEMITKEDFKYECFNQQSDYMNIQKHGIVAITGLPIEECRRRVEYVPIEQQVALVIRFGKNLDELHPFPKKQTKINNLVYRGLKFIMKEPFLYKMKVELRKELVQLKQVLQMQKIENYREELTQFYILKFINQKSEERIRKR